MDKFAFDEVTSSAKTGQQDTVGSLLTKGSIADGIDRATAWHEDEAKRNPNGSTAEKVDKNKFVGEKDSVKLTDICKIQYGYAFDSKCFSNDASLIPLVRIRDVKRGYSETFYSGEYSEEYIVRKNDLLVGMDGEFNIARWKSNDSLLNQRVCRIVASAGIDEEYLRYALTRKLKAIEDRTAFVTVKHLSAKEINAMELALPPISVQTEISGTLFKIESIIEKKKSQIEELDTLIKARFVEIFGDLADPKCTHPKCKLYEACKDFDDIKCGPFGTQLNKDEYQKSGVAVWEIPQVNSAFIEKPTHYVTKEKAIELKAYSLIPGDIAMSRKGNVGRCGLFPEGYPNGIIHSDVLRIRADQERVQPCFLMHQLHYSGDVQRQIEMVSSGAIMAGINVTKLKQIEVYIPVADNETGICVILEHTRTGICVRMFFD